MQHRSTRARWILLTAALLPTALLSVSSAADSDEERFERATIKIDGQIRQIEYVVPEEEQKAVAERLKIDVLTDGGSSSQLKQEAIRALPTRKMHPTHRQAVSEIVNNTALFRRLPTVAMQVEPDVYRFFTTHPDIAVSIWKVLGISEFSMQHRGQGRYTADAGDGTKGNIMVVYQTANECVAVCDGLFQPSLPIKPIRAKAVIHLETSERKNRVGEPVVTHRMDMFVAFPSQPVKVAVKLISPLGHKIIDKNFTEVSRFLKMMSVAMESRPDWVEAIGRRMDGVTPERKQELLELVIDTYSSVRKRHVTQYMQSPEAANSPVKAKVTVERPRSIRPAAATRTLSEPLEAPAAQDGSKQPVRTSSSRSRFDVRRAN